MRLHPIDDAVDTCVSALAQMHRLHRWVAEAGPPFTARHVPVFCLSCAFVTPWLPGDAQFLGARIWSWITAIDDTIDNAPAGDPRVDASVAACLRVAHGGAPGDDPLAAALAGIRDEVPVLRPLWTDTAIRLITGMRARADDLDGYLDYAGHTVGLPMYLLAMWSTMPPFDPGPLLPALRDGAVAVRLANDLRGHERERVEGTLNALSLGTPPETVRALIDEHAARCRQGIAAPLAAGFPPAVALDRMVTWGTRLYAHIDFRFPGQMLTRRS